MEKSIRRKFSDEFKEEAVKRVTEQEYKIIEAAWNLGIHATQLRRWVKDKTTEANPSTASMGQKCQKVCRHTARTPSFSADDQWAPDCHP
nr:transposase [uncultured Desulfobulbus sp.]